MVAVQEKVNTKDRLIEAAEKLFAEKGFKDVSLRDITNQAKANVASVNYYFSSKDALADEVITRHISPVNEARLREIAKLQESHGERPIPVREILYAFMRPTVEMMQSGSLRSDLFGKIMGYCMGDRAQLLPAEVKPQMKEVLKSFIFQLQRSLPNLSPEVVLWRLHFSFGVVAHTLLFSDRLSEFSEMEVTSGTDERSLERVIDYCLGGLLAAESGEQQFSPQVSECDETES
jgi:AcrR family transcriptional regulator